MIGNDGDEPPGPCVVVLKGMPGVGKTWLAEEFLTTWLEHHQHSAEIVRLVPRGDEQDSARLFTSLRDELCDRFKLSPDAATLKDSLAALFAPSAMLLLVENVDGEPVAAAVAQLLALVRSPDSAPCALITSRMNEIGDTLGWIGVDVPPFELREARQQVKSEVGSHWKRIDTDDLNDLLVNRLGGLPLAVNLASGHLRRGWSPTQFWEQLQLAKLELRPADPADQRDIARTILAASFRLTWKTLRQSLEDHDLPASDLMDGLAALGYAVPSGFGSNLGSAIAGLAAPQFDAMCFRARQFNLLQPAEDHGLQLARCDGQRYRVHPLVAAYLRNESHESTALDRATEWFLERLPEPSPDDPDRSWDEVNFEYAALIH